MIIAIILFHPILVIAQGKGAEFCSYVQPPKNFAKFPNCNLTCSTSFTLSSVQVQSDEHSLCKKNSTLAITCNTNEECREYHLGAKCSKHIACFCKGLRGEQMFYIPDHASHIPTIDACTVTTRRLNLDSPIVPFPWKTLLVAFGILASFVVCLIAVRWLSPIIRAMQAKSSARNHHANFREEGTQSFTSIPHQDQRLFSSLMYNRIPRIWSSPSTNRHPPISRHRLASHRRFLIAKNAMTADNPPPYDVAVQRPPPYEEVEESSQNGETSRGTDNVEQQTFLVHSTSNASITTV